MRDTVYVLSENASQVEVQLSKLLNKFKNMWADID